MTKYGTIKHGKVHFKLGTPQQRFLEYKHLPYSIVTISNKGKKIVRRNI